MAKNKRKKTIFLTGGSGILGSHLLKVLLENGHTVYTLVRTNSSREIFGNKILMVLNFWGYKNSQRKINNLHIVNGDISECDLGLDVQSQKIIKAEVEEIIHCAAITDFNHPFQGMKKVNVGGTKNVLDFALKCRNLIKVNHISTAYVAGDCNVRFKEDSLDVGQGFYTAYEKSKFEAEKVIAMYREKKLWVDIFRPPIITGDSFTGKILQFRNIYHLVNVCKLQIFDSLPLKGIKINLVPIDCLSKGMYIIFTQTADRNKNYHTFNQNAISLQEIIDSTSRILRLPIPKMLPPEQSHSCCVSDSTRRILQQLNVFSKLHSTFDCSYTQRFLRNYNFTFPDLRPDIFEAFLKKGR